MITFFICAEKLFKLYHNGHRTIKNYINQNYVTGLFLYPLKTSKIRFFLIFQGGIEKDQQHEMEKTEIKG